MKSNFLLFAALVLCIYSCQNGSEADQKAITDSTKISTEEAAAPAKPANVLLIWQKVSNYNKWLAVYEAHDSARLANGLHNYVIGRDIDDSNSVIVAVHMDDTAKAKAFTASPGLKMAMQKGGVMGAPTITYLDVQAIDTGTNISTTRLSVRTKIKDFDAWKAVYDSHMQTRTDAGLTQRSISRSFEDHNEVSVVFAVADIKKAKDFIQSKDLKERMIASGAIGKPTIHLFTVTKKY